jgi:hypothetical protein
MCRTMYLITNKLRKGQRNGVRRREKKEGIYLLFKNAHLNIRISASDSQENQNGEEILRNRSSYQQQNLGLTQESLL